MRVFSLFAAAFVIATSWVPQGNAQQGSNATVQPGVFDFPLVEGSALQQRCQVSAFSPQPGTICIEFPITESDRVMNEYAKLLTDTGWSEGRVLAGDVWVRQFRRILSSDGCEYVFHLTAWDKFPVNYVEVMSRGPNALREFRLDPNNLQATAFVLQKADERCGTAKVTQ